MLTIRPATTEDLTEIAHLTTELAGEFLVPDCTPEGAAELLKHFSVDETYQRFEAGFRHYVAVDESILVGVIVIRENRHLLHLFVAQSHQHCGIARALWDKARWACLDSGSSGEFTVNSSRKARGVYEAFGFVPRDEVVVNGVPFTPMTLTLNATD